MKENEARKILKELKTFESVVMGPYSIIRMGMDYAMATIYDDGDVMRDYDAYVYGFKLKWVLDALKNKKIVEGV